jgi:hypothetical protein
MSNISKVVCTLDHPATEQTPWGKAVSKKAQEGGVWLTWVFVTEDISKVEEKFGRSAIEGHRTRPDGSDLKWKQIGVNEITDSRELPFFIQWLTAEHPNHIQGLFTLIPYYFETEVVFYYFSFRVRSWNLNVMVLAKGKKLV